MKNLLSIFLIFLSIEGRTQVKDTIIVPFPGIVVQNGAHTYTLSYPAAGSTTSGLMTVVQVNALTKATADIISLTNTSNNHTAQITALQTGGTTKPAPRTLSNTTYTLTMADNNGRLYFTNGCKISFSGLTSGFNCQLWQMGSTVSFSGAFKSRFSRTKINTQNGRASIDVNPSGTIYITGDL